MDISLVAWPFLHPGKCANCGSSTKQDGRQYVDMGLQIPRYGAVYFCEHCIRELGKLFGLVDKRGLKIRELELASAQGLLNDVVEENRALRSALSQLSFLGSHDSGNVADAKESDANSDIPTEPVDNDPKPKQPSARRTTRAAKGKSEASSRPDESTSGSGSPGVLSDDMAAIRAERGFGSI